MASPVVASASTATVRATIRLMSRFVPETASRQCAMGHTNPSIGQDAIDDYLPSTAGITRPGKGRATGGRKDGHDGWPNGWTDGAARTVGRRPDRDFGDGGGGGIAPRGHPAGGPRGQ